MICKHCGKEMKEIQGVHDNQRQLMGHYCGPCIYYEETERGRETKARVLERTEK